MTLSGSKRILITGANGGMGRVTAELAAVQGYQLVLTDLASTDLDGLSRAFSSTLAVSPLDVTDAAAIDALANDLQQLGGIDAIVHTVGVSPNMADWRRVIDIDLIATARFLEAMRPILRAGGAAVCISSSSAYMAPPNPDIDQLLADPLAKDARAALDHMADSPLTDSGLAYSYAKRALQQFVARQAAPWGSEGKRLVSVSPGLIDTAMGRMEYDASENFTALKQMIALGELGKPEDIAEMALFLVSDQAKYVTGCDILVDGGLIAGFKQIVR